MPRPVPMPDSFKEAAATYTISNLSIGDLRRRFGVSNHTIKKWLADLGVAEKSVSQVLSAQRIGKPSNRKGSKHSEESKERMSKSSLGRKPTTLGFKFSEESKMKMSEAAKRRWSKSVVRIKEVTEKAKRCKKVYVRKSPRVLLSPDERNARTKARDACKRMLRRILTMTRIRKDAKTEVLLGYTKNDLRAHIEAQFADGMGWDKRDSFHIDHIKPVAQFFREGIYDPSVINALANLQVLTPQENRAKSDSFNERNRKQALIIDKDGTRAYG